MKREGKGTVPPSESTGSAVAGVSDAAVRKATGKGWGEWFSVLDSAGARVMSHREIVAIVGAHESGEWWQQTISVAYEGARGLREKNPRGDGFSATSSKIIKVGVTRVYAAWTDDGLRTAWLDATGWQIRKATPCRSLRATWSDGKTTLEVCLHPRDVAKTLVQVEHAKLASLDEMNRMKAFWAAALERLRAFLETAEQPHSLAA